MQSAAKGASPASPAAEAQAPGAYGQPMGTSTAGPAPAPAMQPGAMAAQKSSDSAMGGATATAEARRSEPQPESRPGLGTAWGETRESRTTTSPFVRDDTGRAFATSSVWYNDREGANAMARASDYRSFERGVSPVLGGALTVSLRDDSGRVLAGFFAGGKQYVVGEAGQRYVIVLQNNTNYRFEVVASVDGLDVIDGQPAAFTKRGYLIQPYGSLEIDGFRRSSDAVAAFRFSSVRGSYSNRTGQGDRNVGVIGVAFFNERGTNPRWTQEEINKRNTADPFPGRYATPPSP